MISIKLIPNILSVKGRECLSAEHVRGKPLSYYLPSAFKKKKLTPFVKAIHNGKAYVYRELKRIRPKNGDEIIFAIEPRGATAAYYLVTTAIALVSAKVANSLLAKPKKPVPEPPTVYGWAGIQDTARNGQPIPVVYGEHKIGGQVIGFFTKIPETNKEELYLLLGISEGGIESIAGLAGEQDDLTGIAIPSAIKINDNPASAYKGLKVSTRLGTSAQTLINGFRDIVGNNVVGVSLLCNSAVTNTTMGEIEAYELFIKFPAGLNNQHVIVSVPAYRFIAGGGFQNYNVSFSVRHKKSGGAWSAPVTITASNSTEAEWTYRYRVDGLELGTYDIEITRTTVDESGLTISASVLASINEITYDDIAYNYTALIGLKALATEQLSGSMPNITCVIKGQKVRVYTDPTTYTTIWSDNPAWCLLDLLINTQYGLGNYISISDIDIQSFIDWADFCSALVADGAGGTHKRATLNLVLDGATSAWDIINQVCAVGRAALIKSSREIKIKIEQAETPAQMFTMGNIIKGSFKIRYASIRNKPNFIEAQFLNKDNNYNQDIITIEDPEAFTNSEPIRKETINLYGITRPAHAYREAMFRLNVSRYLTGIIEFAVGLDALISEVGDVIQFQHDVPQWGFGGRVVSATGSSVTLDKPITLGAGTYKVRIRLDSDAEEEKTITGNPGTSATWNISGSWTTNPKRDDIWGIGLSGAVTKPYRITEIRKQSDLTRIVTALEYNASIYSDDFGDIESVTYTLLPDPRKLPPDITNLILTERVTIMPDGTLKFGIDVYFTNPIDTGVKADADVYIREYGTEHWRYAGSTKTGHLPIETNINLGDSYDVAVCSTSVYGTKKNPDDAPSDTVAIAGQTGYPEDVDNFAVVRIGDTLYFTWDEVENKDFDYYVIRVGTTWTDSRILITGVKGDMITTTNFAPGDGQQFMIKARNKSGVYSLNANTLIADIQDRINQNIVVSRNEVTTAFLGGKINMTVNGDGHLELDAGQITGSYITPAIDIGDVLVSRIHLDYGGIRKDKTTTWADATYAWSSAWANSRVWAGELGQDIASSAIQYRTSLDGETWSDWIDFVVGEKTFRYLQIKVTIATANTGYGFIINRMIIIIDVPDVFDSDTGVVLDGGVNTITFGKTFRVVPAVTASLPDSDDGDTCKITEISLTGFKIIVKDSNGVTKPATANWVARGY